MTLNTGLAAGLFAALALPSLALADAAVSDPFARATPPNAKNGAAYATISSAEGDRLLSAATAVAKMAEIHETIVQDGVARMREIEGGLEIPAGHTVTLAPGGKHIMLMGLAGPLAAGEEITLTLTFEKAGEVVVTAPVKKLGAMEHGHDAMDGMSHGQ